MTAQVVNDSINSETKILKKYSENNWIFGEGENDDELHSRSEIVDSVLSDGGPDTRNPVEKERKLGLKLVDTTSIFRL